MSTIQYRIEKRGTKHAVPTSSKGIKTYKLSSYVSKLQQRPYASKVSLIGVYVT